MAHPKRLESNTDGNPQLAVPLARESGGDPGKGDLCRRLSADPNFQALVRERFKLRLTLSMMVILLYFSFMLLVAFWPASMASQIIPGSRVSAGIVSAVGLIVLSIAFTAIYVIRANRRFERLAQRVLERNER